jgi:hypothetical protein
MIPDQLPLSVTEVQTRLLFPFSLSHRSVMRARELLRQLTFKQHSVWKNRLPDDINRDVYRAELLHQLFAQIFGSNTEPTYSELTTEAANSMFSRAMELVSNAGKVLGQFRVQQPRPAAEIFLSPLGVGVLSVTIRLEIGDVSGLALGQVLDFNYHISQMSRWAGAELRVPHPQDDPAQWNQLSSGTKEKVPPAPETNSPVTERINSIGGRYSISELANFLLSPLAEDPEFNLDVEQAAVYTVVRLQAPIDFESAEIRKTLAPFLVALSQLQDSNHSMAVTDHLGIGNLLLNRNNWAGACTLGTAHIISDQVDTPDFNVERLLRCRDRYFLAYLWSLIQRLAALRSGSMLASIVSSQDANYDLSSCGPVYRSVLNELVKFNALNGIPDFSHRDSLNQYYRLTQNCLRVPEIWNSIGKSVASLDSACRIAQQETLLQQSLVTFEKQLETLDESRMLQAKVEWVEVFLIAVYFAELIHIVGGSLPFRHEYVGWFALLASLGAITVAFRILRPWESSKISGVRNVVLAALATIGVFLGLGYGIFRESHAPANHTLQFNDTSKDHNSTAPTDNTFESNSN